MAWAGKIVQSLPVEQYALNYPARDDALYEIGLDNGLRRIPRKHPWYHPDVEQQRKDKKGAVLIFDENQSWHFGADGRVLPSELHHLAAHGQGHRVNQRRTGDLAALEMWLADQGSPGIHGEPRNGWDGSDKRSCGPKKPNRPQSKLC